MTYVLYPFISRSIHWAATVCPLQRPDLQTVIWVVTAKPERCTSWQGIISILHGVGGLWGNFARSLLSGVANLSWFVQALPDLEAESPMSWGTLLSPRQARPVGHPRGRRGAMEWTIRNLHTVKMRRLSTQPGEYPLAVSEPSCSENLTASCFVSIYPRPGKAHTPMHREEIAVCP